MKQIAQLTLPGDLDIDLLFDNGKLAYTFTHNGESYGNAVTVPSRKIADIAASALILFTNALETRKALDDTRN